MQMFESKYGFLNVIELTIVWHLTDTNYWLHLLLVLVLLTAFIDWCLTARQHRNINLGQYAAKDGQREIMHYSFRYILIYLILI